MTQISSPKRIDLSPGQELRVEPGGMLAYNNCEMRTSLVSENIFSRLERYFFGGESWIQNTFKAGSRGGWIMLEEHIPGQVMKRTLSPHKNSLMIRKGALLAASPNIHVDVQYLGLPGTWSGRGLTMLHATARHRDGEVHFQTTDGVVKEITIRSEEGPVYVDNHMLLGYLANLSASLTTAGSSVSSHLFSGEGMVCQFEGDGVIYVGSADQRYKPGYW